MEILMQNLSFNQIKTMLQAYTNYEKDILIKDPKTGEKKVFHLIYN